MRQELRRIRDEHLSAVVGSDEVLGPFDGSLLDSTRADNAFRARLALRTAVDEGCDLLRKLPVDHARYSVVPVLPGPPAPDGLASARRFFKGKNVETVGEIAPVEGGPGVLLGTDQNVLWIVEYFPPLRREYHALGLWLGLYRFLASQKLGKKRWSNVNFRWSGPGKGVRYLLWSPVGRVPEHQGAVVRLATTFFDGGGGAPDIKVAHLLRTAGDPVVGMALPLGLDRRDVDNWQTFLKERDHSNRSRPSAFDELTRRTTLGPYARWLGGGAHEACLAVPGLAIRFDDAGTIKPYRLSDDPRTDSRIEEDESTTVERLEATQHRAKEDLDALVQGRTPQAAVRDVVRSWRDVEFVWPTDPDVARIPGEIPKEWRVRPYAEEEQQAFFVNLPMTSGWHLGVELVLERPTESKPIIADFLQEHPADVHSARGGRAYPAFTRLIDLANARCFLDEQSSERDEAGQVLAGTCSLPHLARGKAVETYAPLAVLCGWLGISVSAFSWKFMFGVRSPTRPSVPSIPSRLSTLMHRVAECGATTVVGAGSPGPHPDSSWFPVQDVSGFYPGQRARLGKTIVNILRVDPSVRPPRLLVGMTSQPHSANAVEIVPVPPQTGVLTKRRAATVDTTLFDAVSAELVIDACLLLLHTPMGSKRPGPPPPDGSTPAGKPTRGPAAKGGAPKIPGAKSPQPVGGNPPSTTSGVPGSAGPTGGGPGPVDQDNEETEEIDDFDRAVDTLWDAILSPPVAEENFDERDLFVEWPVNVIDDAPHRSDDLRDHFVAGSYLGFHYMLDTWGITLHAPKVFGWVLKSPTTNSAAGV